MLEKYKLYKVQIVLLVYQEVYLHHKAEKRNQFSFVCIFFNARQKLVNSFTYIKESINYNYVYLILACIKNSV